MTEEWRCPNAQDGAFHVVDASKLDQAKYTYPCIHCGEQVGYELVNSGMARARGGLVNPASVPHDGYNLGPALKTSGKADTVVLVDENDRWRESYNYVVADHPLGIDSKMRPRDEKDWFLAKQASTTIRIPIVREVSYFFLFGDDGNLLVCVGRDGKVEYGSNYTPDEAARIFWEALGRYAPSVGR